MARPNLLPVAISAVFAVAFLNSASGFEQVADSSAGSSKVEVADSTAGISENKVAASTAGGSKVEVADSTAGGSKDKELRMTRELHDVNARGVQKAATLLDSASNNLEAEMKNIKAEMKNIKAVKMILDSVGPPLDPREEEKVKQQTERAELAEKAKVGRPLDPREEVKQQTERAELAEKAKDKAEKAEGQGIIIQNMVVYQYGTGVQEEPVAATDGGCVEALEEGLQGSMKANMQMKIMNVDFGKLNQSSKKDLKDGIQGRIAAKVPSLSVGVTLSNGSIKVDVELMFAPDKTSDDIVKILASAKLEEEVVKVAKAIPAVVSAAAGGITATEPVVEVLPTGMRAGRRARSTGAASMSSWAASSLAVVCILAAILAGRAAHGRHCCEREHLATQVPATPSRRGKATSSRVDTPPVNNVGKGSGRSRREESGYGTSSGSSGPLVPPPARASSQDSAEEAEPEEPEEEPERSNTSGAAKRRRAKDRLARAHIGEQLQQFQRMHREGLRRR